MGGDECDNNRILAFDALFTTNHIQMYKILLPCLNADLQRKLSIYIKYLELQYTVSYFRQHPGACFPVDGAPDAALLIRELLPFCSPGERGRMEQMGELFSNIKSAQEMMETINMMKELFPEGFSLDGGDENGPDMEKIMEMMSMFEKPTQD